MVSIVVNDLTIDGDFDTIATRGIKDSWLIVHGLDVTRAIVPSFSLRTHGVEVVSGDTSLASTDASRVCADNVGGTGTGRCVTGGGSLAGQGKGATLSEATTNGQDDTHGHGGSEDGSHARIDVIKFSEFRCQWKLFLPGHNGSDTVRIVGGSRDKPEQHIGQVDDPDGLGYHSAIKLKIVHCVHLRRRS